VVGLLFEIDWDFLLREAGAAKQRVGSKAPGKEAAKKGAARYNIAHSFRASR
jgi:hypothetical protein